MSAEFIKCFFCGDRNSEDYIYTECSHLVCLVCASLHWDKKYSIKCNNRTTFLEQQTCIILARINKQSQIIQDEIKQNAQALIKSNKYTPLQTSNVVLENNSSCVRRPRQSQHLPISMQEKQNKPQIMASLVEKETELNLQRIQKLLNQSLKKVKKTFQFHHKQLQRKEQNLLKSLYTQYSNHLNSIKDKIKQQDITHLNTKLAQLLGDQLPNINASVPQPEAKDKDDKILNKLDYNQMRMKERINRHYELLK